MKSATASAIVLAVSALVAGQAFAGSSAPSYDETIGQNPPVVSAAGKTRDQVRTELAEARRTGDIVVQLGGDNSGTKLNQLYPTQYSAQTVASSKTREQVRAELTEAQRTGDIVFRLGGDNSPTKLNQLYPTDFPSVRS